MRKKLYGHVPDLPCSAAVNKATGVSVCANDDEMVQKGIVMRSLGINNWGWLSVRTVFGLGQGEEAATTAVTQKDEGGGRG